MDEKTNKEKFEKRGLSLRRFNVVMLVFSIFISIILFIAMQITNLSYQKTQEMTTNLVEWRNSAYNLQIASDYLTEEIRCFSVTGKRMHLDNYFKEAETNKRREKALEKIKKYHEDSDAVIELRKAMDESVKLMNVEYYSARLTIEGYGYDVDEFPEKIRMVTLSPEDEALTDVEKKNKAVSCLFDDVYLNSKRNITTDMEGCLKELEDEMNTEQMYLDKELEKQVFIEHILTLALICIMMGIVLLTSFLVFRPLKRCVDLIRKEEEVPLEGAYEIRFLAKNYNLMYYTNIESKKKLGHDATHDKMTNLYNRRGYEFLLNNVDMETSTLMIIDLDEFKSINDTYGHDVGDKVLIRAARTIFNSFRSQDYICRIGGDEFAVIMIRSDSSMKELITKKVQNINDKLSATDENGTPPISCSVGVAFGRYGLNVSDLFKRADEALYETKSKGKRGVSFYNSKKEKTGTKPSGQTKE